MATLTVQRPALTGITPSYAAAAGGGDVFANDGYTVAHIKNASVGSITVTAAAPGAFNAAVAVAIPAGEERIIGPFTDKQRFNNGSGQVALTYTGVTTLTVGIFRVY